MSVLEVSSLTVEFSPHGGGKLVAVDHLSCALRAGQPLVLVGESSSGHGPGEGPGPDAARAGAA